jgi:hypothetical protein
MPDMAGQDFRSCYNPFFHLGGGGG